ncbi:hypothetical protein PsorP6_013936 [Peronosclerospora sorghi]|uniref:Uncharacterized protein n=1 Tax=Peronosclerospora sorghi TaxID=230839 RepID=A0ACC0VGJ3_9STRA|nr:hypothetical protein PsorP6_013936 [Peronosclerospora sorghi]
MTSAIVQYCNSLSRSIRRDHHSTYIPAYTMGTEWASSNEENQWRRTFCQVPFGAIHQHAENGKRSLEGLVAFLRRMEKAERCASEQLRELVLDELGAFEVPGTGLKRALRELTHFVKHTCRQQLRVAQVLDEQVVGPLESLKDASETYIQTLQGEILNANNEYQVAAAAYREAATRLDRSRMELREAKERQRLALHGIGVPEFELQRLAARVAKCEEEHSQAVMTRARAKTALYNRIIARDEMTMAVSVAYQKAEEERQDQVHKSLHRLLRMEKERLQASQQLVASLETHIQSLSRAEDMQLFIHNQRDPDNMHFQGKALALLDWQWSKMQLNQGASPTQEPPGLLERPRIDDDGSFASSTSLLTTMLSSPCDSACDSPHTVLASTPMSVALRQYFVGHKENEASSSINEAGQSGTEEESVRRPYNIKGGHTAGPSTETLVRETCKTVDGRAMFVKCFNLQRSLETQIKDQASFDVLVACFNVFLDECVRDEDIKAAKTAMILTETFYLPRTESQDAPSSGGEAVQHSRDQDTHHNDGNGDNRIRTSSAPENYSDWTDRTSEELLQYVDAVHPLLHSEGLGRGATRLYLQSEAKKHSIWKSPSFWEKALLLAIGEELQRTPQSCPWEELPTGVPKHDGLPSREEAVCRVHNIVFGQLGSFTLSMLEFDVPITQIESFVETMCDAHELTEDQRFLLRKNLHEIFDRLE